MGIKNNIILVPLIFTVFILDIEDLFNAIKKVVLAIKEKFDAIREEREEKIRKRSATGQFIQMVSRQNDVITRSMYTVVERKNNVMTNSMYQ